MRCWLARAAPWCILGLNVTDVEFDLVLGSAGEALVDAGAEDGAIRSLLTAMNVLRGP